MYHSSHLSLHMERKLRARPFNFYAYKYSGTVYWGKCTNKGGLFSCKFGMQNKSQKAPGNFKNSTTNYNATVIQAAFDTL